MVVLRARGGEQVNVPPAESANYEWSGVRSSGATRGLLRPRCPLVTNAKGASKGLGRTRAGR